MGASSESSYLHCRAELAKLSDMLRRPAGGDGPRRAAASRGTLPGAPAAPVAVGGGAKVPRLCSVCCKPGHRKGSQFCPLLGKEPLPEPAAGHGRRHRAAEDGSEDSGSEESDSGENENVCHQCSAGGDLVCCDGCRHAYHARCLPDDALAMSAKEGDWFCPVCTNSTEAVGAMGNPRGRRARGQKRKKSAGEPTKKRNESSDSSVIKLAASILVAPEWSSVTNRPSLSPCVFVPCCRGRTVRIQTRR